MANKKTTIPPIDEQYVWGQLQEGSLDALGVLYDLHIDILFSAGLKINSDRQVVEDGIHDMFLELYKYHKKLATVQNVGGYLIVALRRRLYKVGGTKEKHMVFDLEHSLQLIKNEALSSASFEVEIMEEESTEENDAQLSAVLQELTEHQQEILRLRFEEEKTYEQIASDMNVSVSSARTLLYRTLKHARKVALSFFL